MQQKSLEDESETLGLFELLLAEMRDFFGVKLDTYLKHIAHKELIKRGQLKDIPHIVPATETLTSLFLPVFVIAARVCDCRLYGVRPEGIASSKHRYLSNSRPFAQRPRTLPLDY